MADSKKTTSVVDVNTVDVIENRLERLEKLVGSFEKHDDTQVYEILKSVNDKLAVFQNNPKIAEAMNEANNIKKLTSIDMMNDLNEDISAKLELVLKEEELIKKIDEDYEKIKKLSEVLDNNALNEVPKLVEKLREVSAKEATLENEINTHTEDAKAFLTNYYNTMKVIGESLTEFNDFVKLTNKVNEN